MMNLRTLIVDDERKIREVLRIKLEKNCPQVEIIGNAENVTDAYEQITRLKPDLIFLDIQMPNGTGFDLIDKFPKIDFEIIFATGYNEFALQALKLSAVDYLLKPIQTIDLKNAVDKAIERVTNRTHILNYEILKHNVKKGQERSSKIAIPSSTYHQFVEVDKIIHCEGWQKYTRIHLESGEIITSSYNLGVFRDLLANYDFVDIHKSHLININKVKRYNREGSVLLTSGALVPVSRRKKELFLEQLKQRGFLQ